MMQEELPRGGPGEGVLPQPLHPPPPGPEEAPGRHSQTQIGRNLCFFLFSLIVETANDSYGWRRKLLAKELRETCEKVNQFYRKTLINTKGFLPKYILFLYFMSWKKHFNMKEKYRQGTGINNFVRLYKILHIRKDIIKKQEL